MLGAYPEVLLSQGRPGRGAQEPADPLVPDFERVVHPRPGRLHLVRYGRAEQAQQGLLVGHPLPEDDLPPLARAVGGLALESRAWLLPRFAPVISSFCSIPPLALILNNHYNE